MLGLNIRYVTRFLSAIFSNITSIRCTNQGIIRMQDNIPTIYFAGHVGPFSPYPTAAYAITVTTSRDKLGMPKWRNNIPVRVPVAPDDNAVAALLTAVAQHGRTILLFTDHAIFKVWQRKLAQVLA
jgi:hypothetical protein